MASNPKNPQKFACSLCCYLTSNKKDFNKHLQTRKHTIADFQGEKSPETPKNPQKSNYECICGKTYNDNSGLWRHKKKCKTILSNKLQQDELALLNGGLMLVAPVEQPSQFVPPATPSENSGDKELLKFLIKENAEFKNLILEILNKDKSYITNNHITNSNNTFNLQFFLHEQCKDALNIDEFVETIKIQLTDLETTGRLGYVEGVSRIINKNLNGLDKFKRPIHCSDIKRETLYIKNNNEWTKEDSEKLVLTRAIKKVANKNIRQICEWKKEHPDCTDSESTKNDLFLKIVSNSMSGLTCEEQCKNYEKIISNVAKEVIIEK
jgi:hypothetical protein